MYKMMRIGAVGLALLGVATAAESAATAYTRSIVCSRAVGGDTCEEAGGYGSSSISRQNKFVQPPGSAYPDNAWNYVAEARAAASAANFGLFAQASGNSFATPIAGPLGMSGSAIVELHDEVRVAGSGSGTIVVPWHVTGGFDVFAQTIGATYAPGASFGVPFCQSIPLGAGSGGKGCTGGGSQVFTATTAYDQVLMLEYAINFDQSFSLNTTFALQVISGASLATGMTGDFSHTGLQQPALVYDSNHNLVLNPVITAASGVDYLDPQASAVPAPAAAWLLGTGLIGLGGRRRLLRTVKS
jgi:hypothetical protein